MKLNFPGLQKTSEKNFFNVLSFLHYQVKLVYQLRDYRLIYTSRSFPFQSLWKCKSRKNLRTSKATVNDARYKVSRIVKLVVSRNSRNKSRLPLLFLLCLSGILQCKLLLLKVQCLDNNRWRYVTSATIYELKEKIISNITPLLSKLSN